MFGAKLVAPFGFVGQYAWSKRSRKELQEYYSLPSKSEKRTTSHLSNVENEDAGQLTLEENNQTRNSDFNTINITRFLLDYVLDMGPASFPQVDANKEDNSHVVQNPEGNTSSEVARLHFGQQAPRNCLPTEDSVHAA
ncbi:hypothetical protein FRC12_024194 [Ceratobasidium sp. 428]|nr:hypothetical protein FRC12_024194 [Ceratobasidium sp. 428]